MIAPCGALCVAMLLLAAYRPLRETNSPVVVVLFAALLAMLVFEQPRVGQVLCGLTCLQGLLYTVFYWHYDKVY